MPLTKYYCDYCDREFNDTLPTRKKHMQSKTHKSSVKFWYDSFKDPKDYLIEEAQKPPCQNLLATGYCEYGANCRYSHMIQFIGLGLQYQGFVTNALPPSLQAPPEGGYEPADIEAATW